MPSTKVTRRVRTAGTRAPGTTADQVERVGGVDGDPLAGRAGRRADLGELLVRGGQRVLLAAEPGDEAPAPHEAAVFEPAQRPLEVAPREPQRVVDHEVAEHDTPAVQQQLGHRLGELVAVGGRRGRSVRPPPRWAPATSDRRPRWRARRPAREAGEPAALGRASPVGAGPADADGAEAVGHHQPAGHAVPQAPLDVVGQAVGGGAELAGEAGTALAQHLETSAVAPTTGSPGSPPAPRPP